MKRVLKEEILELRKQGLLYREIREKLGCTKSVISYHCKNAGLENFNKLEQPTKEDVQKFDSLYLTGLTAKQVADQTSFSKTTVQKYLTVDIRVKPVTITKSEAVVSWRRRMKAALVEYKGGKCERCGYDRCITALEFHHLDPLEKDFTISGKSWKFETLKLEVEKCLLLCSNCHKEEHYILKHGELA